MHWQYEALRARVLFWPKDENKERRPVSRGRRPLWICFGGAYGTILNQKKKEKKKSLCDASSWANPTIAMADCGI